MFKHKKPQLKGLRNVWIGEKPLFNIVGFLLLVFSSKSQYLKEKTDLCHSGALFEICREKLKMLNFVDEAVELQNK